MSNLDTLLKSYLDQKHLLEYSGDVLKALERRLTSGEDVVRSVLLSPSTPMAWRLTADADLDRCMHRWIYWARFNERIRRRGNGGMG
jgi:hypothetical protein